MLIKFVRMGVRGNREQFSMWSMCASVSANGLQQRGKGDGEGISLVVSELNQIYKHRPQPL